MNSNEFIKNNIIFAYANGGKETLEKSEQLQKEAEYSDTIFHCTSIESALSIIKSGQFWMTSLHSTKLNDSEELKRVENEENAYQVFIACFTKNKTPSINFWEEYAGKDSGIIFRFKKEWMTGKFVSLNEKEKIVIYDNIKTIEEALKKSSKSEQAIMMFSHDTGFYAVEYGDKCISQSTPLPCNGIFEYTKSIGLTKPKIGDHSKTRMTCKWEDEQEIRYKTAITPYPFSNNTLYNLRIAAVLSEEAFNEFEFSFSQNTSLEQKKNFLNELKELKPNIIIKELTL